jgi:hypothetical protein
MAIKIESLFMQSATAALALQSPDGSMPPGCNGPYNHQETPIRNTAHWIIVWRKAFEISAELRYKDAAAKAIKYIKLCEQKRRLSENFTFRVAKKRDRCNGLIGAAWLVESLVEAGEFLADETCIQIANELFDIHPWCHVASLWSKQEDDGFSTGFDMTFNHQLWMAAAAALLSHQNQAGRVRATVFLDALPNLLKLDSEGMVQHRISDELLKWQKTRYFTANYNPKPKPWHKKAYYNLGLNRLDKKKASSSAGSSHLRDIGYHAFNLQGFSILKKCFPDHNFWKSDTLSSMLAFTQSDTYYQGLCDDKNPYGYAYNVAGFEVLNACHHFGCEPNRDWLDEQVSRHWNHKAQLMNKSCNDPNTLAARIYEIIDLV